MRRALVKEDTDIRQKLELAKLWVEEAGVFLRENLKSQLEIREKSRFDDLVTNFDQDVQEQIIGKIRHHFPTDEILAEEDQLKVTFSHHIPALWILDPIDGTTNFIVQKDHFAIMLAYYEYGEGKFGLILDVINDKLYWCDEVKAFCNHKELCPTNASLQSSLLAVNAYMYRTNTGGLLDLSHQTLGIRNYGSAGISYAQLLEGKIIAYFSSLSPWDYAAGSIISERIGYTTVTLSGATPHYSGREMLYTAPYRLLPEIKKYIKECP